jgi:hypothetical protein
MDNIIADAAAVKLGEEAEIIRRECAAADEAGLCRIDHAMEAGKHANKVKDCIPRRFRRWLRDNGLKRSTVYDYMLLARNEESVRSSGHCSIVGALRMLRAKSGKIPRSKAAKPKETLARHWKRENELARTTFLDEIGIDEFRLVMSLTFYRRLRDLVRVKRSKAILATKVRACSRRPCRISGPPMARPYLRQLPLPISMRLSTVFARFSKP